MIANQKKSVKYSKKEAEVELNGIRLNDSHSKDHSMHVLRDLLHRKHNGFDFDVLQH